MVCVAEIPRNVGQIANLPHRHGGSLESDEAFLIASQDLALSEGASDPICDLVFCYHIEAVPVADQNFETLASGHGRHAA